MVMRKNEIDWENVWVTAALGLLLCIQVLIVLNAMGLIK
jgi:hypothetical protein